MLRVCNKCKLTWYYPVKECIFCGRKLEKVKPKEFKVLGITEIHVASVEHSQTPYYNLILEDEYGNLHIHKTMKKYEIGEKISKDVEETRTIKVGVIGTGITGTGITEVALKSGCEVVWKSRSEEALKKGLGRVEKNLLKGMSERDKDALMGFLKGTTDMKDLSDADLVIESVIEDIDVKKQLFMELDDVCKEETILASNTSSLSIDEISSATKRPDRVAGMHFFNPVPKMHLVEIIKGSKTSEETINFTKKVAELFNKTVVIARDSPCYIVNRILMPYLNEAIFILEEETASKEDIDTAAKLGLNVPMGPIALVDLIGLDVFLKIMNNLYHRTGNPKFRPPKLVEKMVNENKLGRKTGEGFYKY